MPISVEQIRFLAENYDRAMDVDRQRRISQEEQDREYAEAYVKTFNF